MFIPPSIQWYAMPANSHEMACLVMGVVDWAGGRGGEVWRDFPGLNNHANYLTGGTPLTSTLSLHW